MQKAKINIKVQKCQLCKGVADCGKSAGRAVLFCGVRRPLSVNDVDALNVLSDVAVEITYEGLQ